MDKDGNKTGGRQKGTPNKTRPMTKDLVSNLLQKYKETGKFTADWNALEPKDRVATAVQLMKFVLPTIKATTVDVEVNKDHATLADRLKKLGGSSE